MATRPPLLLALCALLGTSCALPAHVELQRVRGAYSTHFEGIPDRAFVCAVLANTGDTPLDWVRLRMRAETEWEGRHTRLKSYWLVNEHIEPGAAIAVDLESPPIAEWIELDVIGRGQGAAHRGGRAVTRSEGCSEGWLADRIDREASEHGAPDIAYVEIEPRGAGAGGRIAAALP